MERVGDTLDPGWTTIFDIEGFSDRMGAIRERVRPALKSLAERLSDLMTRRGLPVYPHVASHMRRRVNPPNETWLALGPEKRGYKAWGHLGVFIGKGGCSVRFVVKDEAEGPKKTLGRWLREDPGAEEWFRTHHDVLDFERVHGTGRVAPLLETSPREMGERLLTLKTSGCDLGWSLSFETTIEGLAVRLESLSPLYLAANGS
ncbi:MAG: DUF1054 domain-containing protein [Nitrospirae bacterium]|nr:DUF1054 domain-containing protein [Nitrospirota bacterium]